MAKKTSKELKALHEAHLVKHGWSPDFKLARTFVDGYRAAEAEVEAENKLLRQDIFNLKSLVGEHIEWAKDFVDCDGLKLALEAGDV